MISAWDCVVLSSSMHRGSGRSDWTKRAVLWNCHVSMVSESPQVMDEPQKTFITLPLPTCILTLSICIVQIKKKKIGEIPKPHQWASCSLISSSSKPLAAHGASHQYQWLCVSSYSVFFVFSVPNTGWVKNKLSSHYQGLIDMKTKFAVPLGRRRTTDIIASSTQN